MEDTIRLIRSFFPTDGGPIYQETPLHFSHWFVEPWNALSSLFILLPGLYFLWKLRGEYANYKFLTACIPMLLLGGLGSTLFHAFRDSELFLLMDVAPTALLFLMISGYLWYKVFGNVWYSLLVVLGLLAGSVLIYQNFPPGIGVNISYALRGLVFLAPLVVLLTQTQFRHAAFIAGAVLAFALALLCRTLDKATVDLLPMGSHFLWHINTGLGGLLVAEYIFRLEKGGKPPA